MAVRNVNDAAYRNICRNKLVVDVTGDEHLNLCRNFRNIGVTGILNDINIAMLCTCGF
jgi:hypothetical protein